MSIIKNVISPNEVPGDKSSDSNKNKIYIVSVDQDQAVVGLDLPLGSTAVYRTESNASLLIKNGEGANAWVPVGSGVDSDSANAISYIIEPDFISSNAVFYTSNTEQASYTEDDSFFEDILGWIQDNASSVSHIFLDKFYLFDSFYLPEVNRSLVESLLTLEQKVNLPYETKYVFDKFINKDFLNTEILVSTKTSDENKWKSIVALDNNVYYKWSFLNDVVLNLIDTFVAKFCLHCLQT
jgi:hypothetical protein